MTDYPEGARLRVAFDVTARGDGWWQISPTGYFGPETQRKAVSVERLPDPEPDWQPGDVVRAADGRTYARNDERFIDYSWTWLTPGPSPRFWRDGEVPRPLVPLVRDGKPWGAA